MTGIHFIERFVTRKFVAATLTSLLLTASWLASEWLPGARSQLPTLHTALLASLTAYTAGNVVQDHVLKPRPEPRPPVLDGR